MNINWIKSISFDFEGRYDLDMELAAPEKVHVTLRYKRFVLRI